MFTKKVMKVSSLLKLFQKIKKKQDLKIHIQANIILTTKLLKDT